MSVKKLTEIREIRCIYTDAGRLLVQVKEKLRLNGAVGWTAGSGTGPVMELSQPCLVGGSTDRWRDGAWYE